ncbi:MAG: hypothetical protein FWE11_10400 [Defluviitaleaceae bacterium]|nr:hypothetical protein [Defluviitaleaceae bacterium]
MKILNVCLCAVSFITVILFFSGCGMAPENSSEISSYGITNMPPNIGQNGEPSGFDEETVNVLYIETTLDTDIIEIREESFVAQFYEIIFLSEEFIGRKIRFEGIFWNVPMSEDENQYIVFRYADGCCMPMEIGFEIVLNGIAPLPDDTWVEVTGILEEFEPFPGHIALRIDAVSIVEMNERGAEMVPGW